MNKLRLTLNEDGSVTQFAPDFKIIRGSYYDVLINIEVPHSLLVDPVTDTGDGSGATGNNVRVGGLISTANGRILQTKRYEFQYVKDFERAGISYKLYQRKMPKEFTMWETVCENETGENGSLKLVINVVNWTLNDLEAKVEEVSASPAFYLDIYPSEYLTEEEEIESPSDFATLQSQVQDISTEFTTLKTDLYTESGDGLGDYLTSRLTAGNKIVLTNTDSQVEIAVDTLYASNIVLDSVEDLDADNLQTALEEISRRFDSKSVDMLTGEDDYLVDNTDPNNPVVMHDTSKVDVTTFNETVDGLNSAISTNAEGINELNTNLASYSLISDTGAKIDLDIDTTNYVMTLALKTTSGDTLSSQTIDFPLESMVVGASYKSGTLTLTLQNGTTLDIDISSIIDGLVSQSDFDTLSAQVETNTANIATNTENIASNTANISTNASAIATETSERKSADTDLQSQITSNDDDISALQTADTTLQGNIDAEAETRANADTDLQSQITTNTENIATNTSDIADLKTQVETNTSDIKQLTEGVSLTELQAQVGTNTANIETNTANISTNTTAISTETTNRETADTTLQSNIDTEASARETADTTLQNNIDSVDESAVHIAGTETITGTKTFGADNTYVQNLYVSGDIVQSGDAYVTEAEHLKVEDSLIFTRNGATVGLTDGEYTGIVATNYDGTNYGALIYDNAGVARVGDVSVTTADDGTSSITDISTQPLATRAEADDMTDTGLVYWDAENEKFVTSTDLTANNSAGRIVTDATTGYVGEIFNDYTNNTASGTYSHAEGYKTTASNYASHAEGQETTASEYACHAEGINTIASGFWSHAEGNYTEASGMSSHAEGAACHATGNEAHAEGGETYATGSCSHAGGFNTVADQNHQTVIGAYNLTEQSGSLFAVGNGSSSARSNAFEVIDDGSIKINNTGVISYDPDTDTFTI